MSEPEHFAETRRWLRYAAEDVGVAEALLRHGSGEPRHVCYNAEQGAEKVLKAALVFEQIEFPFSHDLDALRNLLPSSWSVKRNCPDLRELSEWAVEARYPGDWPDATREEAVAAVTIARGVYDEVVRDLASRGLASHDPDVS
jgi:HEPN domain-containing protein